MDKVNREGLDSTMIFKVGPGADQVHEGKKPVAYKIVPHEEVDSWIADGWHRTPAAAIEAHEAPEAPAREQMEADALKLGVKLDKRWSDKRLSEEIAAALKV